MPPGNRGVRREEREVPRLTSAIRSPGLALDLSFGKTASGRSREVERAGPPEGLR